MLKLFIGALALVYVSSYEGFGLPVAEAMTSGTLVLLTNSSSLPEVGGPPDISIYVQNPREPLQIKDALTRMTRLPTEERAKRIQLARRYVERFGGGGEDGRKHGWNEMASLLAKHIRDRRKHRGRDCFYE
jgi:glycosyltransferase involved in cell wall biosynthesis